MEKICINCKWCEYNVFKKKLKEMNFFQRIVFWFCHETEFQISKKFPHCMNKEVYRQEDEEAVFGKLSRGKLLCSIARIGNPHNEHSRYYGCGKNGKYFEEKEE